MAVMATFVGRRPEHRELTTLLDDHRVVTLVGPGGVGKTRLATELARDGGPGRFGGGVRFTELAGTSERDDLATFVAQQHGFGSLDAFRLSAASSATLVVLDNCESSLQQAAAVAATLADDGSEISVLATSRAPLGISGEHVFIVEPLAVPKADDPAGLRSAHAVELFVDRAQAAGARWPLDDETSQTIGELVRKLDGLPLAIELAAARSRMLTPAELVRLLDHQLDLLARPGIDATGRHGSLRSAIQTSYDQLDATHRGLFRSLAVFSTPFDLGLAHGVDADATSELVTLDRLSHLVEVSLVDVRVVGSTTTQYRLLDSIRAFAREQLDAEGEAAAATERYVDTVLDFADRVTAEALESFSSELLGRIIDRHTHLVHAIEHCLDADDSPDRARRLYLPMYGPSGAKREVIDLGERMLARWRDPAPLAAEALAVLATATFLGGDTDRAAEIATEAAEHPDATPLAQMIGHRVLGFVAAQTDRPDAAMDHLSQALDCAAGFSDSFVRELDASWAAVVVDPALSADALSLLEWVMAEAAAEQENVTVLWAGMAAAHHHVLLGDVGEARRVASEILEISTDTGIPWSIGASHRTLAGVLALGGDWAAAAPHYRTALDVTIGIGDVEGVVVTIAAAAGAAAHDGRADLAAELWSKLPAGRGQPVITSFFAAEEAELRARHPRIVPLPPAQLVADCRRLLGPPATAAAAPAAESADVPEPTPAATGGRILRFAGCELDLDMRELRRDGERMHIEPQVYDLLVFLIERRGTAVAKHEILDEVWGDRFVSESALTTRVKAARKATGDDGRTQGVIRTMHGHGYSFVAEVTGS